MNPPVNNASTASKLKWLIERGWNHDFRNVQGEVQLTCTRQDNSETLAFSGKTRAEAVNNAFEGIAERTASREWAV